LNFLNFFKKRKPPLCLLLKGGEKSSHLRGGFRRGFNKGKPFPASPERRGEIHFEMV
jgi:hypothetical protein